MKCFIIDTLIGIYSIDDSANILNFVDYNQNVEHISTFFISLERGVLPQEYINFINDLMNSGFNTFVFDNNDLATLTSEIIGINFIYDNNKPEFRDFRLDLITNLKRIGVEIQENTLQDIYKRVSDKLIRSKISRIGANDEVQIIQIIETLDILKKSISLFSSRIKEWYGLHFPEFTDQILEDNILLSKLIFNLGTRDNFTEDNLKIIEGLKENELVQLQNLAQNSMGANFDITLIQEYAHQILSLDEYRMSLEDHLEVLIKELAPNLHWLVGSLIGAKLIAKAGSLKKLAYMPASRIQLLGAEKALYRFLKTGDRAPKHGLIFQWSMIRGSKAHNRGKIARIISGKIGIASKVDYFGGEFIGDILIKEIEEKVKEIELKYPNPPQRRKDRKRETRKGMSRKKKQRRVEE
jgi:nucleolar protein 56